jgi:hypothetical protein
MTEEQEILERATPRVAAMNLHTETGSEYMAAQKPVVTNGIIAQADPEPGRQRAKRSDAGKPRVFVDAPGVRFDLMHVEGRASFKYWIARVYQEGGAVFGNAAVDQLLGHIDRLSERP